MGSVTSHVLGRTIQTLEVADNSECPFRKVSGCEEMELMPGIMCGFESGRVKVDFDINLAFSEENQSSPISNSKKPKLVHVAKVVVFMWHLQPEDTEVSELYECFLCLTRKRKVALISVAKRYLWMVVSDQAKQLSNRDQCVGRLIEGAEFAYNLFLRQVLSLHVKDFFDVAGSKNRIMEQIHFKLAEKTKITLNAYTNGLRGHALNGLNGSVKEAHLSAVLQNGHIPRLIIFRQEPKFQTAKQSI